MLRSFFILIVMSFWLGCTETATPNFEINFSSMVGKYNGQEKSCSTNTGDTLCSSTFAAQYSVILKTPSSIQINASSGNIPSGLLQLETSSLIPVQKFTFKNENTTAIYIKETNMLTFSSINNGKDVFFIFEGTK